VSHTQNNLKSKKMMMRHDATVVIAFFSSHDSPPLVNSSVEASDINRIVIA
jgi:hypothetical protein